ncbi:IclR family transcriptional regulator [Micromonospora sp. NPDC049282]|uniref:IclR family transcriptional regulator n=1 Tax=Micromonospora sp. NPDC049282 TaxID=3364269 RepID=UPI00371D7619
MTNVAQTRAYGEGLGQGANSVLGKARLILESFQHDDAELSLSELSRRTGISKASVHRLAQELVDWGMLERSGFEYRLGMRAFELGSRVPRFRVLRDAARPFMERLHFATKEAVHLAVLDGLEVLYLEKLAAAQSAKPSRIAGRMPLHATSTGKVLLAFSPPSVLEEVVSRELKRLTPHTTVAPGLLLEQIRRIRANGWGVEQEEIAAGWCSVAVPLLTGTRLLLGALSIAAPTYRADVPKVAAALTEVSRRVSSANLIN